MDIRNWPLARIMQLPDCCFGRRQPILTTHRLAAAATTAWLVKAPVSERVVLWELGMVSYNPSPANSFIRFALGDQEPTTPAIFNGFEPLFPGDLDDNVGSGQLQIGERTTWRLSCRMPLEMKGRRFAVQGYNAHGSIHIHISLWFVVSSFPTEVPDWLISGPGRSL